MRVIGVTEGSLETDERRAHLPVVDGKVRADIDRDVLLLAMIDRFGKGTGIGLGFVQGFRLTRWRNRFDRERSVRKHRHRRDNAADMAVAANHLAKLGGGKVVVRDGEVVASVSLTVCGLLTEDPMEEVMAKFNRAFEAIAQLGCPLKNPFSQLEFCFACGEIGNIKLSEEGLLLIHPEPRKVEVVVG